MNNKSSTAALSGIRVLDLSRVLAGPLCCQMLADQGADVVKIESPTGDETRALGPPFNQDGDAAYFTAINRGKRSLSLDLSKPIGQKILLSLLEKTDIVVENFLTGTMEKWGFDFSTVLKPRFPRLIYCTVSGFGGDGPLGGLPGYDAVLQALCGLMSINGSPETGSTRIGIPIVDHITGYTAYSGILTALFERERSGIGQHVEATLFDSAISLLVPHAANWMHSKRVPELLGSTHPNISPYDKYTCADGELFLGIVNDRQFSRFCEHMGTPSWSSEPRFKTNKNRLANRSELRALIQRALAHQNAAILCRDLMHKGVPAGLVNDVQQALEQDHTLHRDMFIKGDKYSGIGSPIKLSRSKKQINILPPKFAEHSREVLLEAGFHEDQIEAWYQCGVLPKNVVK